jgi:glycosyltransferase involved in cell wall biosynthesis
MSKKKSRKIENLLILNYAMDSNNQVFSHQIEVVRELSQYFKNIRVITASEHFPKESPTNVQVYSSHWKNDSNILNLISFYRVLRKVTRDFKNYCIFSHMAEVQSVLTIPFSFSHKIPHFLWYAHQSKSLYLRINHVFIDGIITSTQGSCPIQSKKIHVIGQGIDENIFGIKLNTNIGRNYKLTAVHVGRLDKSKGIQRIIDCSIKSKQSAEFEKLLLIGAPTNDSLNYRTEIATVNSYLIESGKLSLLGKVPRKSLPDILTNCDLFIHSFEGSLDKSLVEATMLGLPVVTNNAEYQRIFGAWTACHSPKTFELEQELESFMALRKRKSAALSFEISRRRDIAINDHSLNKWISKIVQIVKGVEV